MYANNGEYTWHNYSHKLSSRADSPSRRIILNNCCLRAHTHTMCANNRTFVCQPARPLVPHITKPPLTHIYPLQIHTHTHSGDAAGSQARIYHNFISGNRVWYFLICCLARRQHRQVGLSVCGRRARRPAQRSSLTSLTLRRSARVQPDA